MSLLNKVTAIVASGILVLNFATIPTAHAQLPVLVPTPSPDLVRGGNLWTITAFNDASPVHTQMATQGICFEFIGVVGTHFRIAGTPQLSLTGMELPARKETRSS